MDELPAKVFNQNNSQISKHDGKQFLCTGCAVKNVFGYIYTIDSQYFTAFYLLSFNNIL